MRDLLIKAEKNIDFGEALRSAMLSFRCDLDKDIEVFLHKKAIEFQERGLCSVYLLFDEDIYTDKSLPTEQRLTIEGYFTLSHKSYIVDAMAISKTQIQKYGGFKSAKSLDFVLIGQLGKCSILQKDNSYQKSEMTGEQILDKAFEVIRDAANLIPCKWAIVECNYIPAVNRFYKSNGFVLLQDDGTHNQYCKAI